MPKRETIATVRQSIVTPSPWLVAVVQRANARPIVDLIEAIVGVEDRMVGVETPYRRFRGTSLRL